MHARSISSDVILNFVGKVSDVATANSVWVANAFGRDFYVDAIGLSSLEKARASNAS